MQRTHIKRIIENKKEEKVLVKGWVENTRALGKIKFLILRDITGSIQITCFKDSPCFKDIEPPRESVVSIEGKTKISKQAPGGVEIIPEKIELISEAQHPLPIDVSDFSKTELPKRLDYRFLDFHRKRTQAIFKIQATISRAFREYFTNKKFLEMQPPSIISSASEGGTELFPAKYFEKNAYLAQSPQLYKQMVACSMENTFTITPVWRAEKHNTVRHLNETRQMDIEMAFANQMDVMKELEECFKFVVEQVIKQNKEEIETLDLKLKVPKAKYITFDGTMELLKKKHKDDLSSEDEKKLCEMFPDTIIFVHSWPTKIKPFYIMPKEANDKSELSEGFDALYKGKEISSGGQRIHIPELLEKMLKKKGLNPKDFTYYIDSFKHGAPPHAGWSVGLERFTQVLLEIKNIREACMFPRDRDRLVP